MISVITGFINELREAGVPVSMVEAIDGMKAVETIDLGEKIALRETLRATLIKNLRHERAFDTAFDVYFSNVPAPLEPDDPENAEDLPPSMPGRGQGGEASGPRRDSPSAARRSELAGQDGASGRRGARQAGDQLAGREPGRPVGGT